MRNLMAGGVGIAINRDDFNAKALQGNDDFLAQLAATQQHDAGGRWTQGGTDFHRRTPAEI
jgi:hypothetical protein